MRQDILVQFLGQEDLLEEGMAVHFSILVWGIPWTEESEGPIRSQRVSSSHQVAKVLELQLQPQSFQ